MLVSQLNWGYCQCLSSSQAKKRYPPPPQNNNKNLYSWPYKVLDLREWHSKWNTIDNGYDGEDNEQQQQQNTRNVTHIMIDHKRNNQYKNKTTDNQYKHPPLPTIIVELEETRRTSTRTRYI